MTETMKRFRVGLAPVGMREDQEVITVSAEHYVVEYGCVVFFQQGEPCTAYAAGQWVCVTRE